MPNQLGGHSKSAVDPESVASATKNGVAKGGAARKKSKPAVQAATMKIEGIIALLNSPRSTDAMQAAGCLALVQMLETGEERLVQLIVSKGGIEAIIAALKTLRASAAVQEKGCMALFNLAWNSDNHKLSICTLQPTDDTDYRYGCFQGG